MRERDIEAERHRERFGIGSSERREVRKGTIERRHGKEHNGEGIDL